MNYIKKIRAEIHKDFDIATFRKGDSESSISPTNNFRLFATNYWSEESNWDLTKVEIYSHKTNEKLFDFLVNESQFFYSWLKKGTKEYFICAEDIFGGQTVIDLTDRKMESYSPNKDGFIWMNFHLSPDGNTLATIGCYWACSFVIKLFNFSDPLVLPLKEVNEIDLIANDEVIIGWLDNETLITQGIKRVYEKTVNGDYTGKILSEIPVQRQLKINSTQH